MPLLPLGGRGYLWGHNYDTYERRKFTGIYGKCTGKHYPGWIHAANYRLLEKTQVRIGGNNEEKDFILAAANKCFDKFSDDK